MTETHPTVVEEAHARLSPSGSKKWMSCPGSLTLEAAFPNMSSTYSDDGTAMHTVAKMCLTEHWPATKAIGTKVPVNAPGEHIRVVVFTEEKAEKTQGYVDTVRFIAIGNLLMVEHRVDFSNWAGVPGQFGTADAIILIPIAEEPGNFELVVIDLKTGWVRVDPEENTQGMCYALGALNLFEMSHNITRVRIGIYQPAHGGLREWTCSMDDLMAFAAKLKLAAFRVEQAAATFPGEVTPEWAETWLNPNPNEEECRFCRARPTCPAAAKQVEETAGVSFALMADTFDAIAEGKAPKDTSPIPVPADLSAAMKACGFLEDFITDVRAEVERRMLAGETVEGFGLELGRQGARKWTDAQAAQDMLRKRFRLTIEEAFDLSLKSPTAIEKIAPKLTKDGKPVVLKPGEAAPLLKPGQWNTLQALIGRSPASPSVKPAHQIKTPYTVPKPDADSFAAVPDEDLS